MKTAVTCAKPLRESERVYSRPGMPASAVSTGKVTCFSMSTGESDGADGVDLHLVVGDVGHGVDRQPGQREDAEAGRQQRQEQHQPALVDREGEDARIMAGPQWSCSASALPSSAFSRKELADRDLVAGLEPEDDLEGVVVGLAEGHLALLEAVRRAHEDDLLARDGLEGGLGEPDLDRVLGDLDLGGDVGARAARPSPRSPGRR